MNGDEPRPEARLVDLRILATTDLHMHLLPHAGARPDDAPACGLAALAPVIARARAQSANTLLFDNGDLLLGQGLADHIAMAPQRRRGLHPAIAALNALGTDAATLGNHDFSFDKRALIRALAGAAYPLVLTNARLPGLATRRFALLDRVMRNRSGGEEALRIGVMGFIPPQTAAWEAASVPDLTTGDALEAAEATLPLLRAAGADLVVALVHGGMGGAGHVKGAENVAAAISRLAGVGAVIAGHVHEVIPPEGSPVRPPPGAAPVVMAGYAGSHLGVIDLVLARSDGWRIAAASARTLPGEAPGRAAGSAAGPAVAPAGAAPAKAAAAGAAGAAAVVMRAAVPLAAAAGRAARVRIGRVTVPIRSHFALLGQHAGLRLIAMAQRQALREALAGTPHADLPIIVAAAPVRAGGRAGPGHYIDLPAGALRRGDISDLDAFTNRPVALLASGADLADWLERAAGAFRQIAPQGADQPLLEPQFPGYRFDTLDGLTWAIDLARPARYDAEGGLAVPGARRISALCHRGRPVAAEDRFIVATTDHRGAAAGGLFGPLTARLPVIHSDQTPLRLLVTRYLRRARVVAPGVGGPFRFVRVPGATALFPTAPTARAAEAPMALTPAFVTPDGFLQMRLDLDRT